MSYDAIDWSYRDESVRKKKLSGSDLAVLRALSWFFNDQEGTRWTRNCDPGVKKLAEKTGLGFTAVNAAKRRLAEKGLIRWDRAANFGEPSNFKTNRYSIIGCPAVERNLKANEKPNTDEESIERDFRGPGEHYPRPDPDSFTDGISKGLPSDERNWLADALAFTGDSPENRKALVNVGLKSVPSLQVARSVLERVNRVSRGGGWISNRVGYLITALKQECRQGEGTTQRVRRLPR